MTKPFSIAERLKSVSFALSGIVAMLRTQHNARIHLTASIVVIGAGIWFAIPREEWVWLIASMVAVWTAEALNTAFEFLCDVASPEFHPLVKQAKDVAAAAVLIAAIGAAIIGLLVFVPHVFPSL
ncbi:MAG: diacylglycerol kinase family protein [Alphaproteobacteria bacterium]|jgi:diacylglycerol kinase|nr:diacylglycerol kinase family protein [Alphaproteobacteria bacterium]